MCFLRGLDWQVRRHSASSGLESQDWQGRWNGREFRRAETRRCLGPRHESLPGEGQLGLVSLGLLKEFGCCCGEAASRRAL